MKLDMTFKILDKRTLKMKTRSLILHAILIAFFGATVWPLSAIDKADAYKKNREEFEQAERAMIQKQTATESVQRELDKLAEQKTLWERESAYYKKKVADAQAELAKADISNPDEMDRLKREVVALDERLKNAEAELQKVDDQSKALMESLKKTYETAENNLILPGESLEIVVLEDDSFNGIYQVRRGGYVVMPRVGRIYVAGKDPAGAERAIKEALQQTQIRDGTVMVERPESATGTQGPVIYLAGEFLQPGPWRIPSGVSPTVVTTILRSGGVTESADLSRVRVLRLVAGQPLVEEVNVQAILNGVGLPSDLMLNPGDIIMLPAFANVVYVTGNVVQPGQLRLLPDDELTAYSAILRAGGFARFANRNKVYVLRERGNGAKQKIPVSIKELQAGHGIDVILEPKDIVVVPEKFFSF